MLRRKPLATVKTTAPTPAMSHVAGTDVLPGTSERRDIKTKANFTATFTVGEKSGSALRNVSLPPSMRAAFENKRWPAARVDTQQMGGAAPFLKGIRLEFVQSLEEIASGSGGEWGPVWPSVARSWKQDHLGRGSLGQVPDLPWLDTEKCLPFGGGYYGDDLWLVLDYRHSADQPRVVANEFVRLEDGSGMLWRELALSFDEFWRILLRYL